MKCKLLFLTILMCFSFESKTDPLEKFILITSSIGFSYFVYRAYNWLTWKSTREQLCTSYKALREIRTRYNNEFLVLVNFFGVLENSSKSSYEINEQNTLFPLSLRILDVDKYFKELNLANNFLKKCRSNLEKRRKNVNNGDEEDDTFDLKAVNDTLIELDILVKDLRSLDNYLKVHKIYFKNVAFGRNIDKQYEVERSLLCNPSSDLQEHLINYARSKFARDSFPLIMYLRQLKNDLKMLIKLRSQLPYNYPYLIQSAGLLENILKQILNVLNGSKEFVQEKVQKTMTNEMSKMRNLATLPCLVF